MTGAATGGLLQKKLFIKKLHQFQRKAHELEPDSNSLILKLQVGGPAALLITDTNTSAFLRNLRTPILKNICEWLRLKISTLQKRYPLISFTKLWLS